MKSMMYVFYGLETYLIEREVKKVLREKQIEAINLSTYDLEEVSLEEVLEDASMISLFSSNKGILCENASFLTGSSKNRGIEQDPTLLEDYLKHPNPDSIIIFTVGIEKLDERKKIVKTLKKEAKVSEFNKHNQNFISIVKELLNGYQIQTDSIRLLIDRVGEDLHRLEQECEKLKLYAIDSMVITADDIMALTTKNIDIDIFGLIESIVSKNKEKAMETYHEMLKYSEEPIKIIVMLANQFRIIYQSKLLYQKGYTEGDIAKELGIHPYRIKLALQKGKNFTSDSLLEYIGELANLDILIKNGLIDKELGLELFILEL